MQKTKTKVRRAGVKLGTLELGLGAGELISGMCRVCRCTDDRACVGNCYWADEEHTICSACVGPIFDEVIEERRAQIRKWTNNFPSGGFLSLYTVLGEEFGEVGRAILQGNRPNLEVELVQVMAVCFRMLEYLRDGVHHMAIVDHDGLQLRQKRAILQGNLTIKVSRTSTKGDRVDVEKLERVVAGAMRKRSRKARGK